MDLVNPDSLTATVDAVNEAFFMHTPLTASARRSAAATIAARQGGPGAYGRMFAPIGVELAHGFRLFTGEKVPGGRGGLHILGEEACRALVLLGPSSKPVRDSLDRASAAIMEYAASAKPVAIIAPVPGPRNLPGMYCCMKCSVSVWRHLSVRTESAAERFIAAGLKALHAHRTGDGRWMAWPFHYTLLALSEIDLPAARAELRYAAGQCEAELAGRASRANIYSQRRRLLMERILAKC